MKQYIIGRTSESDIRIDYPKISSIHCSIQATQEGHYLVEDLNSTNHTFINGVRIKVSKFRPTDKLVLADKLVEFLWLEKEIRHLNNDYREEFVDLKKLFEDHEKRLKAIDWKYGKKNLYIRLAISMLPFVASLIFHAAYAWLSSISGVLITLSILYQQKNPKMEAEKKAENRSFFVMYRCPKCKLEFGNRDWYLIENDKCCRSCKAQFA